MAIMKKWLSLILVFGMLAGTVSFAEDTAAPTAVPTTAPTTTTATDTTAAPTTTSTEPETTDITDFSDIDYESTLGTAVETLVEKKIISGFPDGTFKQEQTLTRAEFAKIIVCFMGNDTSVTYASGFPDVDSVGESGHWAKGYIKIAKDMGIVSGFPDGTFAPDSQVTYEQATKMIMCALGFTGYAYPEGYIQLAMQKKLFVNTLHKGASSDPISRGSTAILVNNALSITPNNKAVTNPTTGTTGGNFTFSSSGGGGGGGGGGGSDDTRKILGVVWGNGTTMLDTSRTVLDEDELEIRYTDKSGELVKEELPVTSSILPSKYLGKYVRATIKEDDEGDEYISKLESLDTYNYVKSFDVNDFISLDRNEETGEYTFNYYDSSDDKATAAVGPTDKVYIIYNGKSTCIEENGTYAFDASYINNVKIGDFTLISNDKDKKADVILINSYTTSVVSSKNTTSEIIKCKYGNPDVNVSDRNRIVSITKDGMDAKLSEITNFDIIDYKQALDDDLLYVMVTRTTKLGTVNKIYTENGRRYIRMTDDSNVKKDYELNYNYIDYYDNFLDEDKYTPQEDDRVKLYLNKYGKVAAMEQITTSSDEKFGYIIAMGFSSGKSTPEDEDDSAILRVYENGANGAKGSVRDYDIDSTVRIDGKIYTKKPDEVQTVIKRAATAANEGKSTDLNSNMTYSSFIRYEVSGGEITTIDTLLDENGLVSTTSDERYNTLVRSTYVYNADEALSGKHVYYDSSPYGFYKSSSSSRFKVYYNSDQTTMMFIPGNRAKTTYYTNSKFTTTNFRSGMKYYVEAYNLNTQNYAEFVLQYIDDGKSEVTSYSTLAIVTKIETESETGKNQITYKTYSGTNGTIEVGEKGPAYGKFEDLNEGDIILYSTDLDKKVYDYYYVLNIEGLPVERIDNYDLTYCTEDISDRRIKGFNLYPDGTPVKSLNARFRIEYGTAVSYDNTKDEFTINPALSTDYMDPDNAYSSVFAVSSSTKLFVYDGAASGSNNTFTSYTSSSTVEEYLKTELVTAKNNGGSYDGADQVFIYSYGNPNSTTSDYYLRFIYVIKSSRQINPSNYDGVITPPEDPLEDEKKEAKLELEGYVNLSEYITYTTSLSNAILTGKANINAATTQAEIDTALSDAKAVIDDIPKDDAKSLAKDELSEYLEREKYESLTSEIDAAISEGHTSIDAADTNAGINAALSDAKAALEAIVIETERSNAKTVLDTAIAEYGEDFSDDAGMQTVIADGKNAIDLSTTRQQVTEALNTAKNNADTYYTENYLEEV